MDMRPGRFHCKAFVSSEFAAPVSHEPVSIGKQNAVTLPSSRQTLLADFLDSHMSRNGKPRSNPSARTGLHFPSSFLNNCADTPSLHSLIQPNTGLWQSYRHPCLLMRIFDKVPCLIIFSDFCSMACDM